MKYEIRIIASAEKELDKLETSIFKRLTEKILSLENEPRPPGSKKLIGRGEYRLRVGNYRILYTVDDANFIVTIYAARHRREAYR